MWVACASPTTSTPITTMSNSRPLLPQLGEQPLPPARSSSRKRRGPACEPCRTKRTAVKAPRSTHAHLLSLSLKFISNDHEHSAMASDRHVRPAKHGESHVVTPPKTTQRPASKRYKENTKTSAT